MPYDTSGDAFPLLLLRKYVCNVCNLCRNDRAVADLFVCLFVCLFVDRREWLVLVPLSRTTIYSTNC